MKLIKLLLVNLFIFSFWLPLQAGESKESMIVAAPSLSSSSSSSSSSSVNTISGTPATASSIPYQTFKTKLKNFLVRKNHNYSSINAMINSINLASQLDCVKQHARLKSVFNVACTELFSTEKPYWLRLIQTVRLKIVLTQEEIESVCDKADKSDTCREHNYGTILRTWFGYCQSDPNFSIDSQLQRLAKQEHDIAMAEAIQIFDNTIKTKCISADDYDAICKTFEKISPKDYIKYKQKLEIILAWAVNFNNEKLIKILLSHAAIFNGLNIKVQRGLIQIAYRNQAIPIYNLLRRFEYQALLHTSYRVIGDPRDLRLISAKPVYITNNEDIFKRFTKNVSAYRYILSVKPTMMASATDIYSQ